MQLHDWRHRTKVYKVEHGDRWWWECLNPNCLVLRSGPDLVTAFGKAAMHTWVGGYRNTDGAG